MRNLINRDNLKKNILHRLSIKSEDYLLAGSEKIIMDCINDEPFANITVKDIISACEYTGCVVVDQLGDVIEINEENADEIYGKSVEHIDAANGTVRIWTFDKLDQVEGLTKKDFDKYLPANPKWDSLMVAVLDKIRKEMNRLYWNKYQKEMRSPFDNTGEQYSNDVFTVRAYYWGDDETEEEKPNFEWGPIRIFWYKYCGRGMEIRTKMGFDTPAVYGIMLEKCMEALKEDFEKNV